MQNGRVYLLPQGISRWGHAGSVKRRWPSCGRKDRVPEIFADVDMEAEVKYYYKSFFNIELSDGQVQRILSGVGLRKPKGRAKPMQILICIDDTDNLRARAPGSWACVIPLSSKKTAGENHGHFPAPAFVHPAVPYTSHNSAMCFGAEIIENSLEQIIAFGESFEPKQRPGLDRLCVAVLDRLKYPEQLIEFGRQAKKAFAPKRKPTAWHPGNQVSTSRNTAAPETGSSGHWPERDCA